MFKIGSRVEVNRPSDTDIMKNGYHPIAASYICPDCKKEKSELDFIDSAEEENIKKLIINDAIDLEIFDSYRAYKYISFIKKYSKDCSECGFPLDAEIVIFLKKEKEEIEIDYRICYSDTLEYNFNSFLSLGIDIFTILPSLILRWWRIGYKIDMVIPFINANYFGLFDSVFKFISCYESRISHIHCELSKNPFRYIVSRKIQSRFRGKETKLIDNIYEYREKKYEDDDQIYISPYPDGLKIAMQSMYQVINDVKDYDDEALGLKYSGNFHAKFIAGIGEKEVELYLTSYNFGEIENLQFETQCLTIVDTKKYNNEIKVFLEYHRLQTEKIKE